MAFSANVFNQSVRHEGYKKYETINKIVFNCLVPLNRRIQQINDHMYP